MSETKQSKQEEIREGIAKDLAVIDAREHAEFQYCTREDVWQATLDNGMADLYLEDAHLIMVGLHSQGVVIKVAEIQEISRGGAADPEAYAAPGVGVSWERSSSTFRAFKDADYVATMPLIEG